MKTDIRVVDDSHLHYDGINWFKDKRNGYYFSCKKSLNASLQRYVWEKFNGKIPNGYEIHHKDGNKANNDLENLCMMTVDAHRIHHQLKKVGFVGDWDGKCLSCHGDIDEHRKWAIFCSKKCKQSYARGVLGRYDTPLKCIVCGKEYIGNKYRKSKTCSHACANQLILSRTSKLGEKKVCRVCGKEFYTLHDALTCKDVECKKMWKGIVARKRIEERKKKALAPIDG